MIVCLLLMTSCGKEWLDIKRDQKLVVPRQVKDFQALLDNTSVFNQGQSNLLGELSSDDYYVTEASWNTTSQLHKYAYIWEKDIIRYMPDVGNGWDTKYKQIYYANVAIEGVQKIQKTNVNKEDWDNVYGTALFWRAFAYFELAQFFCKPYDVNELNSLGIALPLESDVNVQHTRATIGETYKQIIGDLENSIAFLPERSMIPTRASKASAAGLLSRVYLQMEEYDLAYKYSDLSLSIYPDLLDYNDLDPKLEYPFKQFNKEVILETSMPYSGNGLLMASRLIVDTLLFNSYDSLDLRKALFYRKVEDGNTFKGTYTENILLYAGIGVDEIFLIKMECAARLNRTQEAIDLLEFFLKHRFRKTSIIKLNFNEEKKVLDLILAERRKQLVFRGIRWLDLRRFNKEKVYQKTLTRKLSNQVYELRPNSSLYTFPIPRNVIELNPTIIQNER